MKLRLLTTPLAVALLLSALLGCSKKDDPGTNLTGTGSYKLDGVVKNCEVKSTFFPASSSQQYDQLDITLSTVPQPASGQEYFVVAFMKLPTQPATAYKLYTMGYFSNGNTKNGIGYNNDVTTLQETNGSYSGTFSGKEVIPTGTTPHTVTVGIFANTRP